MNDHTCYNTDGSGIIGNASRVIFPKNNEEVQKAVSTNNNIVPRGAGTNLMGSVIPDNSLVICMKKMNLVGQLDKRNQIVYTEPGITIKELNEKLKSAGFELPLFTNNESTLGGMVARNELSDLSGYGHIKDYLEEVDLINSRGELLTLRKSDLDDVCGMEGLTGIIVRIKLKIIPIEIRSASAFQSEDLEEVLTMLRRLKLEPEIVSLKLYPPFISEITGFPKKYNLLIIFRSNKGKIVSKEFDRLWNKIKIESRFLKAEGYVESEDPKISFDRIHPFILFLERLKVPYIGDLSSNIVYPYFKISDPRKEEVVSMILKLQGVPGKYGIGLKRKKLLEPLRKKIIYRIKQRYDPFWKMNKGKVIDYQGDTPTSNNSAETEANLLETPENKLNKFIRSIEKNESTEKTNSDLAKTDQEKSNPSQDLINNIMFNKNVNKEDEKKS